MRCIIILFLFVIISTACSAACPMSEPEIQIVTTPGTIRYHTNLSRKEFLKKNNRPEQANTVGLTVHNLVSSLETSVFTQNKGNNICIGLSKVKLTIGFDNIDVYIDKKYKAGSCEYKVIKEHENYHAEVARQAMVFFKQDLRKKLTETVRKIQTVEVGRNYDRNRVNAQLFKQVNDGIRPVLEHINAKIESKSAAIDTIEMYQKQTALCKKW